MWSQEWNNILDIVTPYPNATGVDVTPQLVEQVRKSYYPTIVLLFSSRDYCAVLTSTKSEYQKLSGYSNLTNSATLILPMKNWASDFQSVACQRPPPPEKWKVAIFGQNFRSGLQVCKVPLYHPPTPLKIEIVVGIFGRTSGLISEVPLYSLEETWKCITCNLV